MRTRKCNWQCYDAKSSQCRCQCNGLNHGIGLERARENFRKLGLVWNESRVKRVTFSKRRKRPVPPEQGWLFVYPDQS